LKATPKLKELLYLTKEWFLARHVEQGSPDKQILKLFEEGGELSSGFLKNKKDLTKDSIGDATVVLIGLSMMLKIKPENVLFSDDKTLEENVDKAITMIFFYASELFLSKDFLDKINIEFNLKRILAHLERISVLLGYRFEECLSIAYNEIKDRKGQWVNGNWVKEEDLEEVNEH
jgi:hypothetical protein